MEFRSTTTADIPFLQQMLYQAVYWRPSAGRPTFEQALTLPGFGKFLAGWGERAGDTAILALDNSGPGPATPTGAVMYRYWSEEDNVRGYVSSEIPVLVIGVASQYRRQGIATALIDQLIKQARQQGVAQISLMASKDNPGLGLYHQCGFSQCGDTADSILMQRATAATP